MKDLFLLSDILNLSSQDLCSSFPQSIPSLFHSPLPPLCPHCCLPALLWSCEPKAKWAALLILPLNVCASDTECEKWSGNGGEGVLAAARARTAPGDPQGSPRGGCAHPAEQHCWHLTQPCPPPQTTFPFSDGALPEQISLDFLPEKREKVEIRWPHISTTFSAAWQRQETTPTTEGLKVKNSLSLKNNGVFQNLAYKTIRKRLLSQNI